MTIPCLGGRGCGPREFRDAQAIVARGATLFVCDRGNHRISVFALYGYLLRGHWAPPAARLRQPFEPFAAAVDRRGRLFVTDAANGCVHRFSSRGHWEQSIENLG